MKQPSTSAGRNANGHAPCLQREASRALIRATHTLRAQDAQTWPQTLEEYVGLFVQHYPTMRVQIAYFLFEARNPSAEGEA